MKIYLDALRKIDLSGQWDTNRTGVRAKSVFFVPLSFNLEKGFPILTTKKMPFNSILGELIAFLKGHDNAAQFREEGTKIWDANANENETWLNSPHRKGEDDLGRVYGVQWRAFRGIVPKPEGGWKIVTVDQFANVIERIKENPTDRRLIINAWNPVDIEEGLIALPPCHAFMQFDVRRGRLNLAMYQRSCDMFLGVPFNIASYALLAHIVGKFTNTKPLMLHIVLGNAHIYENHQEQVTEILSRKPHDLPTLAIDPSVTSINDLSPETVKLLQYEADPAIPAPMAV